MSEADALREARDEETHRRMLKRARRVVIKVGSAVIATDCGLDLAVIDRLAREISLVKQRGVECIVVSSGAIAAGIPAVDACQPLRSIPEKQAAAAVGQPKLLHAWEKAFRLHGEKVAQVLLTRDDLSHRRRYLNARNTLFTLLHWNIVPIINENDTVMVEEIKFGDNDILSCMMATLSEADAFINLSHIEGLYDRDPREEGARFISHVPRITREVVGMASKEPGAFGRGGMRSKLRAARRAALAGIPTVIANGRREGVVLDVLEGRSIGTLFCPASHRMGSRKHWIAFTSKAEGRITVDEGACRALIHNGKSLLPSGIRDVEGHFKIGAKVRIVGPAGEEIGVGLVNYASDEIQKIKGCKTGEIQSRLGYKFYDEVVHRNNLVIVGERFMD